MLKLGTRHILDGGELSVEELRGLIDLAVQLKNEKRDGIAHRHLEGQGLILLFSKPSLRTRMSFFFAMQQLGGHCIESVSNTRKTETAKDTIGVLQGYADYVMVRTDSQAWVKELAEHSDIPIINGLTDDYHPCQTFADLLTIQETFGKTDGVNFSYIGDGNNMLNTFMLVFPKLGINIKACCPPGYGVSSSHLETGLALAKEYGTKIEFVESCEEAATGSDVIYTDVWASMGFEREALERERAFKDYQVHEDLFKYTNEGAVFMHCMPIERGKEVSQTMPDAPQSIIYQQSENRLHAQKALLVALRK